MSKQGNAAAFTAKSKRSMTTKTLAYCAMLAALQVVLARLMGLMPNAYSRFSLEALPPIVAGLRVGPVAGGRGGVAAARRDISAPPSEPCAAGELRLLRARGIPLAVSAKRAADKEGRDEFHSARRP